jgi:hypothetical protein
VLTPPRQLQSLGGLTGLIEQMKQRFSDTMGYKLLIYPDYGSLDRAAGVTETTRLPSATTTGWST